MSITTTKQQFKTGTILEATCRVCNKNIELFVIGKVSNSAQIMKVKSHVNRHFLYGTDNHENYAVIKVVETT